MIPFVCKRPLHEADFACLIESWPIGEASGSMTESSLARFPSSPVMSMLSTSGPSALSRRSEPLPASAFRRSSSVRTRTHGSRTKVVAAECERLSLATKLRTFLQRGDPPPRGRGIRTRGLSPLSVRLLCKMFRDEGVPQEELLRHTLGRRPEALSRSAFCCAWSHPAYAGTNSGERPARRCGSSRVSAHRSSAPRRLRHSYSWTRPT